MAQPNNVQDRIVEAGTWVNNVLTTLVLASVLWVGSSILQIRDNIAVLSTEIALSERDNKHLAERFERHINNMEIHNASIKIQNH